MMFSRDEVRDMFISILVCTIVFAYVRSFQNFVYSIPATFIIVFFSFVAHEMAHKVWCKKYGVRVFYKAWPFGLIAGLIFMFIPPLKIVAPGYIEVYSERFGKWKRKFERYSHFTDITIKEVGMIATLGPLVNMVFMIAGWGALSAFPEHDYFISLFILVNTWLAVMHLVPAKPLDGAKIITWKPWVWAAMFIVSVTLLFKILTTFVR